MRMADDREKQSAEERIFFSLSTASIDPSLLENIVKNNLFEMHCYTSVENLISNEMNSRSDGKRKRMNRKKRGREIKWKKNKRIYILKTTSNRFILSPSRVWRAPLFRFLPIPLSISMHQHYYLSWHYPRNGRNTQSNGRRNRRNHGEWNVEECASFWWLTPFWRGAYPKRWTLYPILWIAASSSTNFPRD